MAAVDPAIINIATTACITVSILSWHSRHTSGIRDS